MRRFDHPSCLLTCLFFAAVLHGSSALAGSGPGDSFAMARSAHCGDVCERMVRLAEEEELWAAPMWERLLHVHPRRRGAPRSEAVGRGFFVHPDGRRDVQGELLANIIAFFAPDDISPEQPAARSRRDEELDGALAPPRVDHPYCRFPARRAWLEERFAAAGLVFPARDCPDFEEFRDNLQSRGVAVVFSSYYLNNPASAFGHTFLRIIRSEEQMEEDRRAHLDYAIDYAAQVDTPNALVYAFRGITGLFPGTFSIYPYYYKVREYNDLEFRDLFEYELNLDEAQRERLTEHLWELGHTWFRYFYTNRNCSWRILAALEVALPEADLLTSVRSPVIPGETIKSLYRNDGLVREVHWRPSLRTQFAARAELLEGRERRHAIRLSRDAAHDLPDGFDAEATARVLDAAIDLVDMGHLEAIVLGTDPQIAEHRQELMVRRARTRQAPAELRLEEPLRERPERGHDAGRLSAGVLASPDRPLDVIFEHRLVLHDTADPPHGYPDVLALELMRTRIRYTPERDRVIIDTFRFAEVQSVTPADRYHFHLAWQASGGMRRPVDRGCAGCAVADVGVAGGLALGSRDRRFLIWGMTQTLVEFSGALEGPADLPLRAGIGPSAGMRLRLAPRLALAAQGGAPWFPGDAAGFAPRATGHLRLGLLRNLAMGAEGRVEQRLVEAGGLLYVYY